MLGVLLTSIPPVSVCQKGSPDGSAQQTHELVNPTPRPCEPDQVVLLTNANSQLATPHFPSFFAIPCRATKQTCRTHYIGARVIRRERQPSSFFLFLCYQSPSSLTDGKYFIITPNKKKKSQIFQ